MNPKCSYKGCTREVHSDPNFPETDKCIFHAPEKDPQEFRNALAKQIREWRRVKANVWDFSDFVFVDSVRYGQRGAFSNLFFRAVFPVEVWFGGATFSDDAWFMRSRFLKKASFFGTRFEGSACFEGATFSGEVWFNHATFSENANAWFSGARFSKIARFTKAIFGKGAEFNNAIFSEITFFTGAEFYEDVHFNEVVFRCHADFVEAKFRGAAGFYRVTFLGHSLFDEATFRGILDLRYVSFGILGDFEGCHIAGRVRVLWPGEGMKRNEKQQKIERGILQFKDLKFEENGIVDLQDNRLQADSTLIFHTCRDMRHVLLKGTDCSQIEFYNCEWPEFRGRKVVGDEYILRKGRPGSTVKPNPEWNRIAISYQQLAKNFREKLDHPKANDFERGVFEMRRRAALQGKNLHGLTDYALISCYKILSDYSGSLLRPLLWLLVSIPLFAFAYWSTSINVQVDPFFWNSWKLSVQIASVNRIGFEFVRDNRIWSDILVALQVVCTATLVALFLFAVRRRFKH